MDAKKLMLSFRKVRKRALATVPSSSRRRLSGRQLGRNYYYAGTSSSIIRIFCTLYEMFLPSKSDCCYPPYRYVSLRVLHLRVSCLYLLRCRVCRFSSPLDETGWMDCGVCLTQLLMSKKNHSLQFGFFYCNWPFLWFYGKQSSDPPPHWHIPRANDA